MLPIEAFDERLDLTSIVFSSYFCLFHTLPEIMVPFPEVVDERSRFLGGEGSLDSAPFPSSPVWRVICPLGLRVDLGVSMKLPVQSKDFAPS